ncbi:YeeE/YedE family protein [Methylobacterium sp. SD274]|uniref:DUF6691 family protein n=1 Tax=Methylobacterium sp. SD274 TaxID=2782009 RepID=UPI001A97519A|nr:DUF6691 family protein [Methylobacterium sp. SD274]MBO1018415.1 YeeE/YedE family protein [Methylobacterium sp. SD274]
METLRASVGLLAGLLFGFGLALSGMMDPARVLGFLDVAGAWDPSLAFVLAGAVAVSALGYLLVSRIRKPVLAQHFEIPRNRPITASLIAGAVLFGIGWGLVGLCPGPALAGLTLGLPQVIGFVAAMVVGMLLHRFTAAASGR